VTGGPAPWRLVREDEPLDFHILQIRSLVAADPRDGSEHERVVIETPDWVNVLALTAADEAVLVRQFRFGVWAQTLEIPGGLVDPGEQPLATAARELEEETGYRAAELRLLGWSHPNPALHPNRIHHVLATGCERVHAGKPEAAEDIAIELVPRNALPALVRSGQITHGLVLAALHHAWLADLR
jgi:ADP-ribose pyrophosphatase